MKKLVLCIFMLMAGSVQADVVYLSNGDRLTGKIDKMTEGKLVFVSELAGKVEIDAGNIATFETDESVEIHIAGDKVVKQAVKKSDPGIIKASEDIKLSEISAINPPVEKPPKWTGNITAGVTSTHGNTTSETLQLSGAIQKRTEDDRVIFSADYGRGKQEDPDTGDSITTEDWFKSKGKYDLFLSDKFYWYFDGRYEKDKIAGLKSRIIGGSGAGYQWIESEDMNFSTEAGIAQLEEKFRGDTDRNRETSMQAGYNFDMKLGERFKFINDLTYYPSLGQFSDYYLTSTAELRASLTDRMYANLKAILDYDTSPAQGKGSTDTKYILGVGWEF